MDDETFILRETPDTEWKKLNLKVCEHKNGSQSQEACGGVFRDSQGRWISGYTVNLSLDIEVADLWTLLIGLERAWDRGFRKLWVESDSVALMEVIKNACASNHHHHRPTPVDSILKWMAREEWEVKLALISEKTNRLPQSVAGYGLGLDTVQVIQELQKPPNECTGALALTC